MGLTLRWGGTTSSIRALFRGERAKEKNAGVVLLSTSDIPNCTVLAELHKNATYLSEGKSKRVLELRLPSGEMVIAKDCKYNGKNCIRNLRKSAVYLKKFQEVYGRSE